MVFDQETHDLQQRLLAKYSNCRDESADAPHQVDEDAIARGQRAADAKALEERRAAREAGYQEPENRPSSNIICCKQCYGSGSYKEYYNNREMTVHCNICDGEGILKTTGEVIKKKPSVATALRATKVNRSEKESDLHALLGKKRAKLERGIVKLRQQIASYTDEMAQLAHRQKNASDPQERQLIDELLNTLKGHMDSVEKKLISKKEAVEALEHFDSTPGMLSYAKGEVENLD